MLQLHEDNAALKSQVAQLNGAVHLRGNMATFTDGWTLCPGFAQAPDVMWDDATNTCHVDAVPLDDLHLNALCCYGPMQIEMHEDCAPDNMALVGEPLARDTGVDPEPVTVRMMLDGINAWCRKPFRETTNYRHFLDYDGQTPALNCVKQVNFDHDTQRWSYVMRLWY